MENIKETHKDPIDHVSDLNILTCHLLYWLLKDDYSVDVAKIIFHEIYKFVWFKITQNNQKAKGYLGFPAFITDLCVAHVVGVNP